MALDKQKKAAKWFVNSLMSPSTQKLLLF